MPSKPIIIVLDDMKPRIDWLRKWFDSTTNIVWRTNVTDFLEAVDSYPSVRLILLDHDLDEQPGSKGISKGPDGLTGFDATIQLPAGFRNTQILVWSRNQGGAPKAMTDNLRARGFNKVTTLMFVPSRILFDHIAEKLRAG